MFYDSKDFFYKIAPWWARWPFLLWVKIHSYYVEKQFDYVDKIVANSKNVKKRIKKYIMPYVGLETTVYVKYERFLNNKNYQKNLSIRFFVNYPSL